jgi:hypothetical protein
MITEGRVLRNTLSTVPIIWQWELNLKYQELGQALSEMTTLEEGNDWKIDSAVFSAASYVAAGLLAYSVPAPRLFTHGPRSVVFNWSNETNDNLYLTVSADKMSALISSPQRITQRVHYSAKEFPNIGRLLPFHFLQSVYLTPPGIFVSKSDTDAPDF